MPLCESMFTAACGDDRMDGDLAEGLVRLEAVDGTCKRLVEPEQVDEPVNSGEYRRACAISPGQVLGNGVRAGAQQRPCRGSALPRQNLAPRRGSGLVGENALRGDSGAYLLDAG